MKPKYILHVLPILLFASCATPYQEAGESVAGGHMFKRESTNVFKVAFSGNGFTSPKRAKDFAMLRAAEITLEHQFMYFTIIGKQDTSSTDYIDTGGSSYTTGTVSSHGGYSTYSGTTTYTPSTTPVHKPASLVAIRCYTARPSGHVGKVYDAKSVQDELRAKYKL